MRGELAAQNITPAIVFMTDDAYGAERAARYGLQTIARVSDPRQELYRAFALRRAPFYEFLNPLIWWRFIKSGVFGGHGVGIPKGDPAQMPGVFLVKNGKVLREFRHPTVADRPDYSKFSAEH